MRQVFYSSYLNENMLFKLGFSVLLLSPLSLMLGIAPFDIAISLLGFLFVVHSFIKSDFSWLKDTWVRIFIILWFYMIVRGFFTLEPSTSVTQSIIFIRFALFALALQYWLLRTALHREALVLSVIATLICSTVDGLIQLFTSSDLLGHSVPAIDFQSAWRLTAMSGKQNIGAKTMMISIPAIAYLINTCKESTHKLFRFLSFILIFVFILFVPLTGERNATLMMFLGLVLLFFMYKPYRKTLLLLAVFVTISFALFIKFSPGFKERYAAIAGITTHLVRVDEAPESAIPYAALFTTDKNIFLENPIFGVGRKQYHSYCEHMNNELAVTKKYINQCITNAQNIYFEWLDETGLVGTLLFFSIPLIWFRQFYAKKTVLLANGIVLGALIEIILRLWPLASTSSFFFSWCGGPFWLMAGWVFAYLDEHKPKPI